MRINPGPIVSLNVMKEGEKYMTIFELPWWIEVPLGIGIVAMTWVVTLLVFSLACFLLVLAYFLIQDRPNIRA